MTAAQHAVMSDVHLFQLLNAGPGLPDWQLWVATAIAQWLICVAPLGLLASWLRADRPGREQLVEMVLAVCFALLVAQLVTHWWPHPRPFMVHLGTQYLQHDSDPGMPSDHVTVLWSLAISALWTRRYGVWGFPLLAAGLVVGWSRVMLGVHFPYDILAALPVAVIGALGARVMRRSLPQAVGPLLEVCETWERGWRAHSPKRHQQD
ncbi:MAG TPA: undecaprenyl-diphosphatase [Glaciihabitans sp.]|nr:undecaprenyl-diphosphatase [Glaciihabitans sp.]